MVRKRNLADVYYSFIEKIFGKWLLVFAVAIAFTGCYSPKIITKKNFHLSEAGADSIFNQIPDYSSSLTTIKGEGKAIVSEPDNSSHISIDFASTRERSLLTIKNRLGIKGGKILSTPDSLVIYNQIDDFARIVPVGQGRYSRVNQLASVNLVDILTVPVELEEAKKVLENKKLYLVILSSGTKVYINKKSNRVQQIDQSQRSRAPYSRIIYEGYVQIKGFTVPRRITIFSADGTSRVSLLIQGLTINPALGELNITLPDDIPIYKE